MVRCTMNVMLPILVQLAPAVIPIFTNHFKDGQSIQQSNFKNGSIARKVRKDTNPGKDGVSVDPLTGKKYFQPYKS